MSEQFKVGDAVRFTKEALCADSDLPEGLLRVLRTDIDGYVHYADPAESDHGTRGFCRPSWLEPAPVDLKAEKALLLSRISEIDKQLAAEAQGDGLSRLKSIVGETGYFRKGTSFYQHDLAREMEDRQLRKSRVLSLFKRKQQ